jgi:hypothetical protein
MNRPSDAGASQVWDLGWGGVSSHVGWQSPRFVASSTNLIYITDYTTVAMRFMEAFMPAIHHDSE